MDAAIDSARDADRAAPRHPPGLRVLFFTEMWERFSYYGMRALLVLYLVNALGYPRTEALALYGIYTGLVYVTPMFGGWIGDRWLGRRQAAVAGGFVMMLGHFAMAVPALLHLALGLLIVGNGLFKPNTSTIVGALYPRDDARADAGYTIFYVGINLGAFLSPLIAGTLGERVGWHWGFASAGVGMALGLAVLLRWQGRLGTAGLRDGQTAMDRHDAMRIALMTAASIPFVYLAMTAWDGLAALTGGLPLAAKLGLGAALVALAGGAFARSPAARLAPHEWRSALALAVVTVFVIVFWMSFEQAGGSMNLFADKLTDRQLGGFEIPASWFQSINPLVIIALGPLASSLWLRLGSRAPSDIAKQGLGMLMACAGFALLALAEARAGSVGLVSPLWLVGVYVLNTVGELMLSPIGLAMVSRLAPQRLAGMLMGMWFLSSAAGNYLSGALEGWLAGSGVPLYWFLVLSCAGAGVALLALTPLLNRLVRQ